MSKKSRIKAFDLIRGFALIIMVVIHVLDDFGSVELENSQLAHWLYVIASPLGAPVFVFVMGVFIELSAKVNIRATIKRGLMLVVMGYLLNLFRGTLPTLVALKLGMFNLEDIAPYTPLSLLTMGDIFLFAGLASIILTLIKVYVKNIWGYLTLALLILFSSPWLWNSFTGISYIDFVLNMFWGNSSNMNFPLFPWLFYPLLGMFYADFLHRTEDKNRFMFQTFFIGLVIAAIATPFVLQIPDFDFQDIHVYSIGASLPSIAFVMAGILISAISLVFWLVDNVQENAIFNKLYFFSRYVTPFYVIQWLFIGWLNTEVADVTLLGYLIFVTMIILVTDRVLMIYVDYKEKRAQ